MPNTAQDRSRVSKTQQHEVDAVQKVFDIDEKDLIPILEEMKKIEKTTSRKKIYKKLEDLGYQRKPKVKKAKA